MNSRFSQQPVLRRKYLRAFILTGLLTAALLDLGASMIQFYDIANDAIGGAVHPPETPPPIMAQPSSGIDVLGKIDWFEAPSPVPLTNSPTPEIMEKFELRGISFSADDKMAGAYIAKKGEQENYYHIGSILPDNTGTLESVFADHVNIRNGNIVNILAYSTPNVPSNTSSSPVSLPHPAPMQLSPPPAPAPVPLPSHP